MFPFNSIWGPQRQGIFHQFFAIIGTMCISFIVVKLWQGGHLDLSASMTTVMLGAFWVGNLAFTVQFFSNKNEELKVDRFVFPHMLWGQFGLLVLAYFTPTMIEVSMMFSLAAFVFVAFGLSSALLFISVVFISLGFTAIYYFHPRLDLSSEQSITLTAYTIAAMFIAVVNAYFGNFQVHLSRQNSVIKQRTDELEAAQKQLLEAKNIAENAAESKTHFLAAASHDLRQPLHALELYIGALQSQDSESERQHIFCQMEKSASELAELLNALFDISRFDAKVIDVDIKTIDLKDVVEGLDFEFRELSQKTERPLRVRSRSVMVESDPILVHRIMRGLVANALTHSAKGRVLVGFRSRGGVIRCEIWDSGWGVAKSEQTKIFEEFSQLNNTNRDRQKGLGLGLALIKRMCESLDHDLGMRSEVGRGSVFWFDMNKGNAKSCAQRALLHDVHSQPFLGRTIMCVDDEEQILDGMALLLQGWGCVAIKANSAREALNILKINNREPDLLICDYRLEAGRNGIDAIDQIQAFVGQQIPAILITGDIGPSIGVRASKKDIKLLKKPISPNSLCEQVGLSLHS